MPAPVVHINGHPGSGKLTIAQALQRLLPGSRLLDNHALLDPALALFDRSTPELRALRAEIRAACFKAAQQLPDNVALILTDALDDSDYAADLYASYAGAFAEATGRPIFRVILDIDEEENVRRLTSEGRKGKRKLMNPGILRDGRETLRLLGAGEPDVLHIDVTHLSADSAAGHIRAHLDESDDDQATRDLCYEDRQD